MIQVLLIIHLFLALGLVIVVLLQRSEGGALGMGGGGGGTMGGLMTTRGSANLLTRATAVIAACFPDDQPSARYSVFVEPCTDIDT